VYGALPCDIWNSALHNTAAARLIQMVTSEHLGQIEPHLETKRSG
jgi:hypothetical protein